ncbi:MAG TPA: hypothetical protein VGM87_02380, partial [Roseomonas sp.]
MTMQWSSPCIEMKRRSLCTGNPDIGIRSSLSGLFFGDQSKNMRKRGKLGRAIAMGHILPDALRRGPGTLDRVAAAGSGVSLRRMSLLSVALGAMAPAAWAENAWIGPALGDWNTPSNWSVGLVPGNGGGVAPEDQAVIGAPGATGATPGPAVLDLSGLGIDFLILDGLTIGSGAGVTGSLTIRGPGATIFIANAPALTVGDAGGSGMLTADLTAGGNNPAATSLSAYSFSSSYTFGRGAGSVAQIDVRGTGLQNAAGNNAQVATFFGPNVGPVVFGDQGGTARVMVDGAAVAFASPITDGAGIAFGRGTGSLGSMTVVNGGRGVIGGTFGQSGEFRIGAEGGRGEVTVTGLGPDGTPSRVYFLQGQTLIGHGPGSVGVLDVFAGGEAFSGPGPCGGGGGNNGGNNNAVCGPSGPPIVGAAGGSGTASISGPGSVWYVTGSTSGSSASDPQVGAVGDLTVGGAGGSTGVLTIADGARVALGQGAFVLDPSTGGGFLVSLTNFTTGLGILHVADPGSTGTVNFGAPAGSPPVAPGTLEAAAIQFGDPNGRLVFNHTATDFIFAIPTSGPGSLQTLAGTTILTTPGA